MLLPGVGFDVVPSDCLAAHLKRRLPDANDLKLYLSLGAEHVARDGQDHGRGHRRRHPPSPRGRHVTRDWAEAGSCDFGEGERPTIQVSWGDVATAFHSTGIPNIEVHFEASPAIWRLRARPVHQVVPRLASCNASSKPRLTVCRKVRANRPTRRAGLLVGVARNDNGESVRSRLRTPEGYALTAATALDAARRVAAGEFKPGFETPSLRVRRRLHPRFRRGDARGPQSLSRRPPGLLAASVPELTEGFPSGFGCGNCGDGKRTGHPSISRGSGAAGKAGLRAATRRRSWFGAHGSFCFGRKASE